ncbi:hypothetical protein NOJ28_27730 [Neorhizobium galegae]|uniref:hypothetical protein n=1 Tax=Neorhizobium galegae TaxID=399 RepID=UPI002107277D|nr:hypothetical protein [Neorhizobium galegae]MCQ1769320.1 hypothetical protein [Neorhizobium galegae]MCQ1848359.1 hypothetical protein [Neorhizobium galegae]
MKPSETPRSETPTGLSPSADSEPQKTRKVIAGRGLVMFIAGVAVAAFCLYMFIALYGIYAHT